MKNIHSQWWHVQFERFLERCRPFQHEVLRRCPTARGILRCQADENDACQDAVLRLLKARHQVHPDRGIDAYFAQITRNSARDLLRRKGRTVMGLPLDQFASETADPARIVEDQEAELQRSLRLRAAVEAELAAAGPHARRIWRLHHEKEMTFVAIARLLGRTLGGVTSSYYSVVRRLRTRLAGQEV